MAGSGMLWEALKDICQTKKPKAKSKSVPKLETKQKLEGAIFFKVSESEENEVLQSFQEKAACVCSEKDVVFQENPKNSNRNQTSKET